MKIVIRTGSRQSAVGSRGKSLRVIYNLLHSYIYLCPPTYVGLKFEGIQHRGIDDARNIATIYKYMNQNKAKN